MASMLLVDKVMELTILFPSDDHNAVGANAAIGEHNQEITDCLFEKGYGVVAADAPPMNIRRAGQRLLRCKE